MKDFECTVDSSFQSHDALLITTLNLISACSHMKHSTKNSEKSYLATNSKIFKFPLKREATAASLLVNLTNTPFELTLTRWYKLCSESFEFHGNFVHQDLQRVSGQKPIAKSPRTKATEP